MAANGFDDDQTRSFTNLAAGTIVSHYKIISKIGAGGMGEVYLAEDTQLDRKVALKFLPPHLSQDEAARARFTREAKAAAKLDHPNIVQVFEVGEFQGRPFFAMAHIEGKPLREVIKEGKLSINEAIEFTKQICDGLHKAHQSGIVHRDIKPGNIIIDEDNKARILDFGLATIAGEEKLTKTGSTLGTVGYMSPEQIEGKKVDHRSDLFSVGVILYEMLTGRRPFDGDNDAAVTRSITDTTPEPIARYKSCTTGELQQIVDKALSKDPSMRYQHADGMLADLRRLHTGSQSPARKKRWLWAAAAVVVIAAAVSVYFSINRATTEPSSPSWTRSIAVLPFRDLSPAQDQAYLCEGMADAIIGSLGRLSSLKDLKVTGLTSVLRFGDDVDLKKVADELKVESILTGTIIVDAGKLRVRTRLISAADESQLWSDTYDREMKSVFAVQDDISLAIAQVLELQLSGQEAENLSQTGTDNIEAYKLYLMGRHIWNKRNAKDLRKSIDYFNRAIELDPNYAPAYSGLADAWIMLVDFGISSPAEEAEALRKAEEAANRAIELDDRLAEAYASLGLIEFKVYGLKGEDQQLLQQAEEAFERAISLNPGYAWSHIWYSELLRASGREEEFKYELFLAYELDPMSPAILHAVAQFYRRRGDVAKAESLLHEVIELEPTYPESYSTLAELYSDKRLMDSALTMANLFIEYSPDSFFRPYVEKGWALYHAGMVDSARSSFQRAIELGPERSYAYFNYGNFCKWIGDLSGAKRFWELSLERNPDHQATHQFYGILISQHFNMLDEGARHLRRSIELNPAGHYSYEGMALIHGRWDNYDSSMWFINRAFELAPDDRYRGRYLKVKADLQGKFNFVDSAVATLEDALLIKFDDGTALWELAGYCAELKNYEKADSLYQVLTQLPDSMVRAQGRGHAVAPLVYQGKIEQAIERLKEAITVDLEETGNSVEVRGKYLTIGELCCLSEDYEAALDAFEQAKRVEERLPSLIARGYQKDLETMWLIAEMLVRTGRADSANALMEVCYSSIDPSDTAALSMYKAVLAGILEAKGDYDSAVTLYQQRLGFAEPVFMRLYNLGVAYLRAGRAEEAVEMLQKAANRHDRNRLWFPWNSVLVYKYLGDAYDLAGRSDDAIKQYEIFLDYWKNADEGLKSVEDAKTRLAKLKETI